MLTWWIFGAVEARRNSARCGCAKRTWSGPAAISRWRTARWWAGCAEASALLARIDALNRRYGHAIDDGEYERWPGFFVEDALYKITTRWNHDRAMPAGLMLCQGRAMMQDRVSALRSANIYEPHFYRHPIDPLSGIGMSDGAIAATASFAVWRIMQSGAPEIFCTGKYVERIVEADGALKFSQRIVVCDGERIDTMIVIPL